MYKKIFTFFVVAFLGLSVFAFGKKEEPFSVKLVAPNGGPAIAISKLVFEKTKIANANIEYEIVEGAELLQARIISGEADIAVVPSNLAAILHAKGADITYLATLVWGNVYCLSNNPDIKDFASLKGKTICSFGRGMTPDLTVREVLNKNVIRPDTDVKIEYLASVADIASAFLSGKAETVIIAEPVLSQVLSKKANAKLVFDVQKEWEKLFGESYPQAGVIVKNELLKTKKDFVDKFLVEVEKNLNLVNSNPKLASEEATAVMKLPPATIVEKAIPGLNLKFVSAKESRNALENYFSILEKINPKFIGGKMPAKDFYY